MATHPLCVKRLLFDSISKCHFTTTEGGTAESTWVACGVAALEDEYLGDRKPFQLGDGRFRHGVVVGGVFIGGTVIKGSIGILCPQMPTAGSKNHLNPWLYMPWPWT